MHSVDRHYLLAYAGLLLCMLFWSGNNVLARAVINDIPPLSLSFWRWASALVVLMPFAYRHIYRDRAMLKPSFRALLVLAALGISGFNALLYTAAHTTTAMNITLIVQLGPAVTLLLAWPLLRQKPKAWQTVGIVVSLGGVIIIISRGSMAVVNSLSFSPGDLIMVWALLIICLYTILIKYYALALHPLTLVTALAAVGTTLSLPFYLWERTVYGGFELNGANVAAILYSGIFSSALANTFFNHGVAVVGPTTTNMFMYLQPVFTFLIAIPVLGERLSAYHIGGGLFIIAGVSLATIYRPR